GLYEHPSASTESLPPIAMYCLPGFRVDTAALLWGGILGRHPGHHIRPVLSPFAGHHASAPESRRAHDLIALPVYRHTPVHIHYHVAAAGRGCLIPASPVGGAGFWVIFSSGHERLALMDGKFSGQRRLDEYFRTE